MKKISNIRNNRDSLSNKLEKYNNSNSETKVVGGKLYLFFKDEVSCQKKYLDLKDKKTIIAANAQGYNINDIYIK